MGLPDPERVDPGAEVVLVGEHPRRRVGGDPVGHQLLVLVGGGAGPHLVLRGPDDVVVVDVRAVLHVVAGDAHAQPTSETGPYASSAWMSCSWALRKYWSATASATWRTPPRSWSRKTCRSPSSSS